MARSPNEQFSKQETERRFEAALRGAFKATPMPMKNMASKRHRARPPKRKTLKDSSA